MKRSLIWVGLVILIVAIPACAVTKILTWDIVVGQTWDQVRIYERNGTPTLYTYILIGEVAGTMTSATMDLRIGHNYIARSVINGFESDDSNAVVVRPDSPKTLRFMIP